MGSSQAHKAANHELIVNTAARRIRRDGVENVAVAELMRDVGLTHGGFYRHFNSREELVAESVAAALDQGSRRVYAAAEGDSPAALTTIIDGYLSALHRDKAETGCAVAALPTDIARCNEPARTAYSNQVRSYLDLLTGLDPDGDPGASYLILSALVGALALARAVNDEGLSDEILASVGGALHRYVDEPAAD